MALSKTQIISNALAILGKKIITNLGTDDITNAAEQAFDMLYPAEIEIGKWRFATTLQQLSLVNAVPLTVRYRYIFKLPADYLKLINIQPQMWDFEIYENKQLYCNFQGPLFIEYQFLPDISQLTYSFCAYMAYLVAEYLCLSNAQSVQYAQYLTPKVEFYRAVSKAADSQNRPQTPLQSHPAISNRFVGVTISG